jgi:hypothetical protein
LDEQELRQDKQGTVRAGGFFFYGKGNKNHQFENRILHTTK